MLMCLIILASFTATGAIAEKNVPRMTKEELKKLLGNSDVIIIDVRMAKDWGASKTKIKGAVWEDPDNLKSWADKYPKDKTLVLYCSWFGEFTSAGLAQKLLVKNYKKVYALKGGWIEWLKAKYPVDKK